MAETWQMIPYLAVPDGRAAIAFYKAAFGATEGCVLTTPDGAKIVHSALDLNGATLYLADEFRAAPPPSTRLTLHLEVPDADAAAARAVAAGAQTTMPMADMFWGARYGQVVDPFGVTWALSTQKRQPTPEEIKAGLESMT